jgi:dTDP-4-dehydrorhamnose reductase
MSRHDALTFELMPQSQPRYLVVGADGMVGNALLTRLRQTGLCVLGTTRRREHVNEDCLHLDLADDLQQWRPPQPVDVAILCAAETRSQACKNNPAQSANINVKGILQLARNLQSRGAFVIFLSTNQVFDGSVPFRSPRDPCCPVTEYGRQKAEVERQLSQAGAPGAIVRLTKILGPRTPLFATWAEALRRGQSIQPFSDMPLAPVPLSCVVSILLLIAGRRLPGIFQVSGDRDITYEAAARTGASAIGADPRLVKPVKAAQNGVDTEPFLPVHTTLDMEVLRLTLGIVPPSVEWTIKTAFMHPQLLGCG